MWIAVPLFIQTMLIFWLGYRLARLLKLRYVDAAPAAMIGASNHFEVALATSTMFFGLSSNGFSLQADKRDAELTGDIFDFICHLNFSERDIGLGKDIDTIGTMWYKEIICMGFDPLYFQ